MIRQIKMPVEQLVASVIDLKSMPVHSTPQLAFRLPYTWSRPFGTCICSTCWDKRDDFNFHITDFPFLSSNIPTSPAYGVFISQLIRYARACSSYGCFILMATRLSNKLLEQGYVKERLSSSLRKLYGRYGDLIKQYEVSLPQMLNSVTWPYTMTAPYWSDFVPNSTFNRN